MVAISRSHTLEPRDAFWFLLIRGPHRMSLVGAARTQDTFKLQAGHHIGMSAVGKRVTIEGVVGSKSGRQDHCPHPDLVNLCLLLKVHCPGRAVFLARLASPPLLKIDTVLGVNHILEGNGLGVRKIGGLSLAQAGIVEIDDTPGTFFCTGATRNTQVLVNVTGRLKDRHLEVSRLPGYTLHFSKGQQLDVGVPADLDQFGRNDSHSALVGGKGLVKLSHDSTDSR